MSRLRSVVDVERTGLPRPPAPVVTPAGFVAFPPCCQGLSDFQRQIYEIAFAQAQAVVQPSLPERDLAGVWN